MRIGAVDYMQNAGSMLIGSPGKVMRAVPSGAQDNRVAFNPIKDIFEKVNDSQIQSEQSLQDYTSGESDSIHKVIIDMEEAVLSMKLASQVRNKAVEAYQDILRMQI